MVSQNDSTTSTFSIIYDGESLSDNTINARDVANSIIAIDDLFQRSNRLLNGDNASLTLDIRPPRAGSFEIELVLSAAQSLLGSDYITSARNLLYLLFGSQIPGLFQLLKRLRGRTPKETDRSSDSVTVEADWISLDGVGEAENLRMVIPTKVFQLSQDRDVRKAASDTLTPLRRNGIDKITVREGAEELETFVESDIPSFSEIPQIGESIESVTRQFLTIVTTRFRGRSRQWQFYDGNKNNWYTVMDDGFRELVRRGEISFTAGDIFDCEVKTVQSITAKGEIKTDLEILRVIGRVQSDGGGTQLQFISL